MWLDRVHQSTKVTINFFTAAGEVTAKDLLYACQIFKESFLGSEKRYKECIFGRKFNHTLDLLENGKS